MTLTTFFSSFVRLLPITLITNKVIFTTTCSCLPIVQEMPFTFDTLNLVFPSNTIQTFLNSSLNEPPTFKAFVRLIHIIFIYSYSAYHILYIFFFYLPKKKE